MPLAGLKYKKLIGKLQTENYFQTPADVIVFRKGNLAVAVKGDTKETIASSTDHAETIQAAIDHLEKGKIIIHNGEYQLSSGINITKGHVIIEGVSKGSVTLKAVASISRVISIDKPDHSAIGDIILKNLVIYGYNKTGTGIYTRNLWYSVFEDLEIAYCNHGIETYADSANERGGHVTVSRVHSHLNAGDGLHLYRVNSWYLEHVVASNNKGNGIYAIWVQSLKGTHVFTSTNEQNGVRLDNCQVIDIVGLEASANTLYGVYIRGGGGATYDVRLTSIYIEASGYHGIRIEASDGDIKGIRLIAPEIVKNNRVGVYIIGDGYTVEDVKIIGGRIVNNSQAGDGQYAGVYIDGVNGGKSRSIFIYGTTIGNVPELGNMYQKGIQAVNDSDYIHIIGCPFKNAKTPLISLVGVNNVVKNNEGYATENSGTATISAGSTSVTVEHGLASTPSKVIVTPIGDPGDRWWVANVGSSSFEIHVATAPSADIKFYWTAEV